MREDSLIASNVNVSYGGRGVVSTMHDTILHEIGPFTPTLSVGSTQKMNFVDTDDGLFWLDDDIRSSSKFDVILDGQSEKEKTKIQLLSDLQVAGLNTTTRRFFNQN